MSTILKASQIVVAALVLSMSMAACERADRGGGTTGSSATSGSSGTSGSTGTSGSANKSGSSMGGSSGTSGSTSGTSK